MPPIIIEPKKSTVTKTGLYSDYYRKTIMEAHKRSKTCNRYRDFFTSKSIPTLKDAPKSLIEKLALRRSGQSGDVLTHR